MDGNWIIVAALCEREPGDPSTIYPVLALLPIDSARIEDVWHTDGMRATGSNDFVIDDEFVPAHRLVAVSDIYTERLSQRFLAYEGVMQKDKPVAAVHLGQALVRLRSLRGLLADTVGEIETIVAAGDPVARPVRGQARLTAAHIVHESRAVIGDLLGASGASAHFLDDPVAAHQARRRRHRRPCGVRRRHQSRTRRGTDNGNADSPHRDGVNRMEFR